jgi:hypothetical protein
MNYTQGDHRCGIIVTDRDSVKCIYAAALLSLSSRMTMVNPTIWLAVFAFVVIFVVHRLWTLQRVLTSVS